MQVIDCLINLSDRLGENSVPTNQIELSKRIRFLDQALKKLVSENYYWFLEDNFYLEGNDTNKLLLPSKIRDVVVVWADGQVYESVSKQVYLRQSQPNNTFTKHKNELIFNNKIKKYVDLAVSLTAVDGLITATSTAPEILNLAIGNYVKIANCNNVLVNGVFEIIDKGNNFFAFKIDNNLTTGNLGTNITAKKINVIAFGYKNPKQLVGTKDNIEIPDEYCCALDAYACSKFDRVRGRRASAQDCLAEFTDIQMDMNKENLRIKFYEKYNSGEQGHFMSGYLGGAACTS